MPHVTLDPPTIANLNVPNYSHATVSDGVERWLHVSGQVGLRPDGSLAGDAAAQIEQAFANLGALLDGAGMTVDDVIHLRIYLLDRADIPALRTARKAFLGDRDCASTLLIVSGLVNPDWKVELEIVAAQ